MVRFKYFPKKNPQSDGAWNRDLNCTFCIQLSLIKHCVIINNVMTVSIYLLTLNVCSLMRHLSEDSAFVFGKHNTLRTFFSLHLTSN